MNKRTLIIIVVTAVIVVSTGGTGLAKGPESATLIGPDIEEPIELIHGDPDHFSKLLEQTGIWIGTSGPLPGEPVGELGPMYTLTWINSGPPGAVAEGRTIRQFLYPHAVNGAVIHTPAQVGLEGWGGDVVGWFIAPEGLTDTLVALGLPVSAPATADQQTSAEETAPAPAEGGAVASSEPDRDVALSGGAGDLGVKNDSDSLLLYLAIGGLSLLMALVWAWRRREFV